MSDLFEAVGTEVRVNGGQFSYFGQQVAPRAVRLTGGDMLVVFVSDSFIKFQRYDASGAPVGSEVFATAGLSGYFSQATVAALEGGGFALAYTRQSAQGGEQEVWFRLFDAAGTASAPVQVTPSATGADSAPAIAALPGGGFVMVWANAGLDGSGSGIFMQRFDAAGQALGAETQVNVVSNGDQSDPQIAVLDGGGFVIAWNSDTQSLARGDIVARRYDAAGVAQGGEFTVNLTTAGDQRQPAIAALSGGGFGIVWTSDDQDRPGGSGIILQRFDAAGSRIGSETVVNSFLDGNQRDAAITRLDGGDFVVSWTSAIQDGSQSGIFGQAYSSSGVALGTEFRASTTTAGAQSASALVATAGGGFAAIYQSPDPSFDGIYLQRYAPSGGLAELRIAANLAVSETAIGNSTVAVLGTNQVNDPTTYSILSDSSGGAFAIAGNRLVLASNGLLDFETQTSVSLTLRATSSTGQQIDRVVSVQVTDGADETRYGAGDVHSAIVRDGSLIDAVALTGGGYALAWRDRVPVYNDYLGLFEQKEAIVVRVLDATGALVAQYQQILTNPLAVSDPVVVATAGNGFAVSWATGFSGSGGLWLQRFDGSGAAQGAAQQLLDTVEARDGPAELLRLSNGDLLAINNHFDSAGSRWVVDARRFAADGSVIDPGSTIASGTSSSRFASAIALPDGGYVLSYVQDIPGSTGARAYLQRFDASGAANGPPQQIGNDTLTVPPPDIALLSNGNLVASWSGTATYPDFNTYIQLFDSSGNPLGQPQVIDPDPGTSSSITSVTGLADGGFAVQWMTLGGLKLMRFDAAGVPMMNAPLLLGGQYALQSGLSLVAGTGRGFLATWTDPNGDTTTGNYDQTWQAFDLSALYGTDLADTLTGSAFAQSLFGYGGDDILTGGGGIDRYFGGAGNDRINLDGASTGSHINGGSGSDTLAVTGAIQLGSLSSIEAIALAPGSALTLTSSQLTAGLAANTVVTGSGSLVVNLALAANVFMSQMNVAASVAVTVNGSAGNDIYKGPLGASSTANMGDGNDFVRTGQLADVINGGAGSDKIIGLGGSDTITGGTGADQFRYLFAADSGLGSAADRILDFTNGEDRLDFRLLDANPALAGRQLLSFIGTGAFTASGTAQLRYGDSGSDTVVQIDLDGNGTADMEIVLAGHAGQGLSGAEFMF